MDEFSELDRALEAIGNVGTTPTEHYFDELTPLDERPLPPIPEDDDPPLPARPADEMDADELGAMLDAVVTEQSTLRPRPDLSLHIKPAARAAAEGQPLATFRALDIDAELALYADRPPTARTMRDSAAAGAAAPRGVAPPVATTAAAAAPASNKAPWGEQTYRGPVPAAAAPATAATAPTAAPYRAQPVSAEFDLTAPPDEEKEARPLPTFNGREPSMTLNITTINGRQEVVTANDSWTVQDLLWIMGSRLQVWQIAFFALSECEPGGSLADRWLNPRNTLKQEGLSGSSKLSWKIKYFKYPKKLRDPNAVFYFYAQIRAQVIDGTLETNITMAFKLAALQVAIHTQGLRPQDVRAGALWNKLAELGGSPLPHAHMDQVQAEGFDRVYMERRILAAYERVKDLNKTDAIYAYLKTVSDLPLYGCTVFNVTLNGEPRVVGVAEDGILLSVSARSKLPNFTTIRGEKVVQVKYEFTPYEDITKVQLGKGTVTVVILSDSDSATHQFQCSAANAVSMVELLCGYRRMLEAYVRLSASFVYPLQVPIPHPGLYAKPVARKKLAFVTCRTEVFRSRYLALCAERKVRVHMPLVQSVDFASDTGTPFETLSLSGLRWLPPQLSVVLEALIAAKDYTFVANEDFVENMRLALLDLSGNHVVDKAFLNDLSTWFPVLSKHPFELRGIALRNCRIDDAGITALKPVLAKLKNCTKFDLGKNSFRDDGLHQLILGARDANGSFESLCVSHATLKDHKIMKLVAAMLDKNSVIRSLDMSDCNIGDIGIAFLLKGLAGHRSLASLNLSGNKFGSSQASVDLFLWAASSSALEEFRMARLLMPAKVAPAVASLVAHTQGSALRLLDVSGNNFGSKGTLILQALAKNHVLHEVHLGMLQITEKNVEHLCTFLKGTAKCLRSLDLRQTPIAKKLVPTIFKCLSLDALKTLNLTAVPQFTGKANGGALTELLKGSTALEKLIVSGIVWDRDSWKGLLLGVQASRSLLRLELDGSQVEKGFISSLRDTLRQVPTLRELSLRKCSGLSHEALLELLGILDVGTNSALRLLDVRGNNALIDLTAHKKYGADFAKRLEAGFLELRCDHATKKK